jgi:hypothetical protein
MQILELINLQEQPNENGEGHTVMRNGREQEGTIKFFIFFNAVLLCWHLCPGTSDTQAGNSNSPVTTYLYTRSDFMDYVCNNTKNFFVILIVISLDTLAFMIILSRNTLKINAASIITGHSFPAL